mmetsp:Transcript_45620/g.145581  ORF Transcript_45620/g.145581 Transcript_45620/m.145581 type:complete len:291 (-) Transcript_45620:948-1820(-)
MRVEEHVAEEREPGPELGRRQAGLDLDDGLADALGDLPGGRRAVEAEGHGLQNGRPREREPGDQRVELLPLLRRELRRADAAAGAAAPANRGARALRAKRLGDIEVGEGQRRWLLGRALPLLARRGLPKRAVLEDLEGLCPPLLLGVALRVREDPPAVVHVQRLFHIVHLSLPTLQPGKARVVALSGKQELLKVPTFESHKLGSLVDKPLQFFILRNLHDDRLGLVPTGPSVSTRLLGKCQSHVATARRRSKGRGWQAASCRRRGSGGGCRGLEVWKQLMLLVLQCDTRL